VLAFSPGLGDGRTLLAGTDRAPPETVPLNDADFSTEAERDAVMRPWAVTDAAGSVLPHWLGAQPVYAAKGRLAAVRHPIEVPDGTSWPLAPVPVAG
jgi:hypothetical protein